MSFIEITLPKDQRPKTWNTFPPAYQHQTIQELSELAHGAFEIRRPVQSRLPTRIVNEYLMHVFGNKVPRVRMRSISPKLFTLVFSRYLYDARLAAAMENARHHNLPELKERYMELRGKKAVDTLLDISEEADTAWKRKINQTWDLHYKPVSDLEQFGADLFRRYRSAYESIYRSEEAKNQSLPRKTPVGAGEMVFYEEPADERQAKARAKKPSNHVYLTVDDGPGPLSREILEELRKAGAKATFFVLPSNIEALKRQAEIPNPEATLQQASQSGHEVGSHSNTHDYTLENPSDKDLWREIDQPKNRLEQLLDRTIRWFRFPGGRMSQRALTYLAQRDMQHADWSIDTYDHHLVEEALAAEGKTPEQRQRILEAIEGKLSDSLRHVRRGDVILVHDSAPLATPNHINGLRVQYEEPQAQAHDEERRYRIARARGQFLRDHIQGIVKTLRDKGLEPVILSPNLSDYSRAYQTRYWLKRLQAAMPTLSTLAIKGARSTRNLLQQAIRKIRRR